MSETTTETVQAVETTTTTEAAPPAAPSWVLGLTGERPEQVPEKFWSPDGGVKVDQVLQSYRELETAFSGKREKIAAEIEAERRKGVPEKPEGYEFKPDPSLIPEGFRLIPPGDDDPMLTTARGVLHRLGGKAEDFAELSNAFVKWQMSTQPDVAAEKAKLGEGAEGRISAVDAFLAKHLDQESYTAMAESVLTAAGLKAVERLMKLSEGTIGSTATPAAGASGEPSRSDIERMMSDPDYWNETKGTDLRAKVSAYIQKNGPLYAPRR